MDEIQTRNFRRRLTLSDFTYSGVHRVFDQDGGGAQVSEDSCDASELKICVESTPRTPVGLPRTKEELDAHCLAYQTGMACMDAWIKRCLPTDGQKLVQQQIGGARVLMKFLCTNDTAFRKDYTIRRETRNIFKHKNRGTIKRSLAEGILPEDMLG
ncbi:jg16352 [Pararge aegeria aegeria]|uniref:Jg16352 protein n=1 Tax=Pararge aegeria aegeria TaxID=348720 RepID=A0A8S4S1Q1_9NEOP|nr:jg16352 [Pararge aegeria aegeria]